MIFAVRQNQFTEFTFVCVFFLGACIFIAVGWTLRPIKIEIGLFIFAARRCGAIGMPIRVATRWE